MIIKVKGNASNSIIAELIPKNEELNNDLMSFLRSHNIAIASSCFGEGVCNKCVINKKILSCQLSVSEFLESELQVIEISYL